MSTGPTEILKRCPHCKQLLRLDRDGTFPYHDFPKPTRRLCYGSKQKPDPTEEAK
jgi:hypothetical protein